MPELLCRYRVKDMLGQGTFGQVVRCLREDTHEEVAVKVIKNQTAFYHQVLAPPCVRAATTGQLSMPVKAESAPT